MGASNFLSYWAPLRRTQFPLLLSVAQWVWIPHLGHQVPKGLQLCLTGLKTEAQVCVVLVDAVDLVLHPLHVRHHGSQTLHQLFRWNTTRR